MGDALTPEQAEFFPTPAWCVRRFLEAVELPRGDWLEPCVGEGAIIKAVTLHHAYTGPLPLVRWWANDIREVPRLDQYRALWRFDWTKQEPSLRDKPPHWSVGITNPPFSKALSLVQRLRRQCDHVAILQRLNWLEGEDRAPFLREHPPDVFVLPNRPCFTGDGKTDGCGYAWYRWPRKLDHIVVLDSTPIEVRRRDEAEAAANRYRGPEQLGLLEVAG